MFHYNNYYHSLLLCTITLFYLSTNCVLSVFIKRILELEQRPLLPREVETRLPDCWDAQQVRIHLSRLPVMPPSTFNVNWLQVSHSGFLDVSRSNGGLRISGWIGQLSRLTIFSTSLSVAVSTTARQKCKIYQFQIVAVF